MDKNEELLSYSQIRLVIEGSFDKYQPYFEKEGDGKMAADASVIRFSQEMYAYLFHKKIERIKESAFSFFSSKNTTMYKNLRSDRIHIIGKIILDVIDIIDEDKNPRSYETPPLRILKRQYPHI